MSRSPIKSNPNHAHQCSSLISPQFHTELPQSSELYSSMASFSDIFNSTKALFLFVIFSLFLCFSVSSFEFEVGNTQGWSVPPANDSKLYNDWASKNRFQIGDTIHFKYEKDSVMLVNEEEYKQCNSTHPTFFSNNGNTEFKFDRSGLFYFISGVSGHCERGQKMIIKVMTQEDSPPGADSSSASSVVFTTLSVFTVAPIAQLVLSF